jgi:hypothetical protein
MEAVSSTRNPRTCEAVVTTTHITWGEGNKRKKEIHEISKDYKRQDKLKGCYVNSGNVRFETLAAVMFQVKVFWVVTPCSVVVGYQCFRRPCCLHLQSCGLWRRVVLWQDTNVSEVHATTTLRGATTQKTWTWKWKCISTVKIHFLD